ncbi:hypothetical protein FRC08_010913 [Ceratobasidium sp. 394]|nr:hypothetical protein FRC08_010913 [Ceratobasidium sp. 394]
MQRESIPRAAITKVARRDFKLVKCKREVRDSSDCTQSQQWQSPSGYQWRNDWPANSARSNIDYTER